MCVSTKVQAHQWGSLENLFLLNSEAVSLLFLYSIVVLRHPDSDAPHTGTHSPSTLTLTVQGARWRAPATPWWLDSEAVSFNCLGHTLCDYLLYASSSPRIRLTRTVQVPTSGFRAPSGCWILRLFRVPCLSHSVSPHLRFFKTLWHVCRLMLICGEPLYAFRSCTKPYVLNVFSDSWCETSDCF